MAFCLMLLALACPAQAQNKVLGAATLENDTQVLALSPYTIVQKDPDQAVNPQSILASGGAVLNGKLSSGGMVRLGFDGVRTWLVIKLYNDSDKTDWIIDLGRRGEGRVGYVKSVRAYEFIPAGTQAAFLGEIAPSSSHGIYKVRIARGEQKFVLLNIAAAPGLSTIVPLKIFSENAFLAKAQGRESMKTAFGFALGGFGLLFFTIAAMRRRADVAVYGAYFAYAAVAWVLYDTFGSSTESKLFDEMVVGFTLVYVLISIFMTKIFCGIGHASFTEKYILYGLAWMNIVATLLSYFLPFGNGVAHICLLYGGPLLTLSVLTLMSYAQAKNGQLPGYMFCLSWLMPLLGMAVTVMGAADIFPPVTAVLNAFWYMLFVQGLTLALAVHQRLAWNLDLGGLSAEDEAVLNLGRLKETKDNADHSRLLKVIEKEREVLSEFRQQESIRTEEMRRAKEAADEANRAKSAFLAVVSHEIRTPMTGIMGMVRLLLDSSITKQQRDYVLTIQESSEAMLSLLNDILDFEKIQRGKIDLESISFDLHRLIQGVINLMSGHAAQKNITLSARMDDDIPKFVKGDPTRLRQVLLNLMGNSIKFTQAGGVTLFVKSLEQKDADNPVYSDRNMIYFAVQDTGIGIPLEAQRNLFTPFTQVNSSIARKFGGTGLGLAISKGLIEAMGSSVNINSKEGEGSTFFFTLEMQRGIASNLEGARKPTPALTANEAARPLNILVVDDNAINCKVAQSFLERDHHTVSSVHDADAALRMIQQNTYDLVLMDIELPGMKGNEAVRLLRDHPNRAKAKTPVLAMTGNVDKESMEQYLADGMDGIVAKPIDPDKLKSMIVEISHKTFEREIRAPGGNKVQEAPKEAPGLQDMVVHFELDDAPGAKDTPKPQQKQAEAYVPAPPPPVERRKDAEIFNAGMLQSLKETLGAAPLDSLLDDLLMKTDEIVKAMDEAVAAMDIASLGARAHELKGMAGNFGLMEISEIAALAEKKIKANELDGLEKLVRSLPDANARAKSALQEWAAP